MRITRRQLKRIIREEHENWGMGKDEESRTHPGEEDYTGHQGDLSKTHPGEDFEGDTAGKAHAAIAAIHDLASAAGVELDITAGDVAAEPEEEMAAIALENRRRRRSRNLTERQLRKIIRQEKIRLFEDSIDSELDHLRKNVHDDIEHIRDLKDDIKDDHEEEIRAEKEKKKHESVRLTKRRLRRIVREELNRSTRRRR